MISRRLAGPVLGMLAVTAAAHAQSIGTFTWQQQPYCNLLVVNIVQQGGVYQVDGYDNQCGATTRAAVTGMAFPNPDGTIGMGLTIVTAATAAPLHLSVALTLPSASGTWKDSTGQTGAFTFTTSTSGTGSARPTPVTSFPSGISLSNTTITNVATPVNVTDAATKGYVDTGVGAARGYALGLASRSINIGAYAAHAEGAASLFYGCIEMPAAGGSAYLDLPVPAGARIGAVRAKYDDNSSADLTFTFNRVELSGASLLGAASSSVSTSGTAEGELTLPLFSSTSNNTTSTQQSFFVTAQVSSHTGQLNFCGVSVDFVLQ